MNDQFLHDLRRPPSTSFARRLRATLDANGNVSGVSSRAARRYLPLAASLALVSLAFAFPGVRASAQAFLDLFRISSVVGVAVDTGPLRNVIQNGLNLESMLGGSIEELTPQSEPVEVASVADASATAGFDAIEPAWRPVGLELSRVRVGGPEAVRLTLNLEYLELLMDAIGIDDLSVPQGYDGQQVTVRIPSVVSLEYGAPGSNRAALVQAPSPEITLPEGFDLPAIAEIALRIAGVGREEAFDLAWTVDWRSTFIVPVPAGAAGYERIDIGGHEGVAIVPERGSEKVLLWADGAQIYALSGNLELDELLEMAQSAQ